MMPSVINSGVSSCTLETPMLPPAALRPSAHPFIRSGKKNEMLVMLEAKLPPPRPAVEAISSISQNGVSGWATKKARGRGGMKRGAPLKKGQVGPPEGGTPEGEGKGSKQPD